MAEMVSHSMDVGIVLAPEDVELLSSCSVEVVDAQLAASSVAKAECELRGSNDYYRRHSYSTDKSFVCEMRTEREKKRTGEVAVHFTCERIDCYSNDTCERAANVVLYTVNQAKKGIDRIKRGVSQGLLP